MHLKNVQIQNSCILAAKNVFDDRCGAGRILQQSQQQQSWRRIYPNNLGLELLGNASEIE